MSVIPGQRRIRPPTLTNVSSSCASVVRAGLRMAVSIRLPEMVIDGIGRQIAVRALTAAVSQKTPRSICRQTPRSDCRTLRGHPGRSPGWSLVVLQLRLRTDTAARRPSPLPPPSRCASLRLGALRRPGCSERTQGPRSR